jgi:hypothetical protein
MSTQPECQRDPGMTCLFCDAAADDPCPLAEPDPFAGPAIGATKAAGTCSEGDVCEACQ